MAKKPKKRKRSTTPAASTAAVASSPQRAPLAALTLGATAALLAAFMSLLLVLEHVADLALPGCGEGSACQQVAEGFWGSIRIGDFAWPVSFLGLAYFVSLVIAWFAARGALPTLLRWVVRLGVLGSLGFCVIMLVEWKLCQYCIGVHIANFAFWLFVEFSAGRTRHAAKPIAAFAIAFMVVNAGIGIWDSVQRGQVAAAAEKERSEAVQEIIDKSRESRDDEPRDPQPQDPAPADDANVDPNDVAVEPPDEVIDPNVSAEQTTEYPYDDEPFVGRYRLGPDKAPIRIVMITGYQCPDCYRIEHELESLIAQRDDIAVSIKHFPFNTACNPFVSFTSQPNGCWAARAAEAAGILWGTEGFWKMHRHLFDRRGGFTRLDMLKPGFYDADYDPQAFAQVMTSDETLQRVQADCREAKQLGLFFTPMIFINGVELRGWHAPRALARTIEEVAAANPPARSHAVDKPPLALQKYVVDWQEEPVRDLPADEPARTRGPANAAIEIVLWGDYQESGTVIADGIVRDFMAGRDDVAYTFRHAPFSSDCNPNIPFRRHVLACWASRAAEAAGIVGGADAYWRMHDWLMAHHDSALRAAATELGVTADELRGALYVMTAEACLEACRKLGFEPERAVTLMEQAAADELRAAVGKMGLDADAFFRALESAEAAAAITQDLDAGKRLPRLRHGARPGLHGIPTVFVNGKWVPRWRIGADPVLDDILEVAAPEK